MIKTIAARWVNLLLGTCICATSLHAQAKVSSDYLYAWTGSTDSTQPDFLAVFDVRPSSSSYGRLLTTLPVPGHRNRPHHTEYQMPADGRLFANGFATGQTFIFDIRDATHPKIAEIHVTGLPDERLGEVVLAWIRLKAGETADAEEIRDFCRNRIARYKIPQCIRFVDSFPTTLSGKIQKFRIREIEMREQALKTGAGAD